MFIRCRARVSPDCHQGKDETLIYEDGMAEDGTYDRESQSVVCTPCYIDIGMPLLDEIPRAISEARAHLAGGRNE